MKEENKVINLIINLAKFIFSEVEFNKFFSLIKLKLFNQMRLFVEEKLEFLETRAVLYKNDPLIEAQITRCRDLDTAVTDLYLNSLVVKT